MARKKNTAEIPYDDAAPDDDPGERVRRIEVRSVRDSRPGGSAPDKRVRIDPAPCEIPKRTSDTTLF